MKWPLIATGLTAGAFLLGWFGMPAAMLTLAQSCEAYSTVIHDEQAQTVYSRTRWYSETGHVSHNYSETLVRSRPGSPEESMSVEGSFRTEVHAGLRYLNVSTITAHHFSRTLTETEWLSAYTEPLAGKGFHASVWLFRTGGKLLTGFEGRPRGLCQPPSASH